MLKVVALAAALSACAHPRRALVGGAGMIALGVLAESSKSSSYCSDPERYTCAGTQIGDSIATGLVNGAGSLLLLGGVVAIVGGLVGLSNEHPAVPHKM